MDKRVRQVLDGGLGEFWIVPDARFLSAPEEATRSGFIRQADEVVEVHLLLEGHPFSALGRSVPIPAAILGATEHAGVLVIGVLGTSRTASLGGGRASVERYRARSLLCHPSVSLAESALSTSASGYFLGDGLLAWADIDAVDREFKLNAARKVSSATIRLKSTPDLRVPLSRSVALRLSGHWSLNQDDDLRHVVETALEVEVESTSSPRALMDLLGPLLRCQELLSLAFHGFVRADGGRAGLPGIDERAYLWDAALTPARVPYRVRAAATNERPLFHLADIGGVNGLARWMRLCIKHPRAVSAIVSPYRRGIGSNEVRLLELAAAIEYWVAAHRRRGRWTRSGSNQAEAVAKHVGPAFTKWVQDPTKWAKVFWDHYNGLKHEPTFNPDSHTVAVLQESAELLLTVELLCRVAGTKRPARQILTNYRHENLGGEVQKVVAAHRHRRRRGR